MDENLFEKIEEYLNGDTSSEEKLRFETEMAKSEELNLAVTIYKRVETDMRYKLKNTIDESLLKETLEGLGNQYFQNANKEFPFEHNKSVQKNEHKATTIKMKIWVKASVAAVFIGIVGLGIAFYVNSNKQTTQLAANGEIADTLTIASAPDTSLTKSDLPAQAGKPEVLPTGGSNSNRLPIKNKRKNRATLFAENFKPDQVPVIKNGPLQTAFAQYENKKYADAIAAIDGADVNIVTRGEETDLVVISFYASYYKALSYMALNDGEKAIPELEKAIALHAPGKLKTKAYWYLSLAFIQTGDLIKAEKLLKQIEQGKTKAYKTVASKLIDELKDTK